MLTLDQLEKNQAAVVVDVHAESAAVSADFLRRLNELGFMAGESVRVIAHGLFGGAPFAVRIGTSTFALRLAEARCVRVTIDSVERAVSP
jgi:ferrous iron transport protein A